MMIALTKYEQEMKNYLDKAILMAPCYTFSTQVGLPPEMVTEIKTAGAYAFNGPNFDIDLLCAAISEQNCGILRFIASDQPIYETNPLGLQLMSHITQI